MTKIQISCCHQFNDGHTHVDIVGGGNAEMIKRNQQQ